MAATAAGVTLLCVATTLPPAVGEAGAAPPTTLYAFAAGSGSGCTSTSDDCSLSDALGVVAPSSATVIDLESVATDPGAAFVAPPSGWTIDAAGASVTIQSDPATGSGRALLDGALLNYPNPLLNIVSASAVDLQSLELENGFESPYGSGVNEGTGNAGAALTVDDCYFTNFSSDDGAAIDIGDTYGTGSLTVIGSTFVNSSANDGGAIDLGDIGGSATATITNSTFTNDSAIDGGAIDVGDNGGSASLTVTNSTFTSNYAERNGGAIDSGDSTGSGVLTVSGSTLSGNSTGNGDGGAIDSGDDENNTSLSTGVLTVTNSTLDDNTAYNTGGAIDNGDGSIGTLTVTDSALNYDASTTGAGGAIDTADGTGATGTATITGSTFVDDHGGDYGGAIANADDHGTGTLSVASSTFSADVSTANGFAGGAISNGTYFGDGTLSVSGSLFTDNGSTSDVGGAIATGVDDGGSGLSTAAIESSTFSANSALDGGAVANGVATNSDGGSGLVRIDRSTLVGNTAENDGAAVANGIGGAVSTIAVLTRDTVDNGDAPNWAIFTHQQVDVAGTVVAGTAASLCEAAGPHAEFFSYGYDAEQDAGSCSFLTALDRHSVTPDLAPLAANGGPTPTELPSLASPLNNVIPPGTTENFGVATVVLCASPDVDQRGLALPAGDACSVGSVNVQTIPNAPLDLSVTATASSISATWQPPSTGPAPTSYRCTLLLGFSQPSTFTVTTTTPACTFSGLASGTGYGIEVVANGIGGPSPPVSGFATTLSAGPPTTTPTGPTTHTGSRTIASFAPGSAVLTRGLRAEVAALRWRIVADGARAITVVGYTDDRERPTGSPALGLARAAAVAAALRADLASVGWSPVSITVRSRGAGSPVASNATAAGRARDRRVVVSFTFTS